MTSRSDIPLLASALQRQGATASRRSPVELHEVPDQIARRAAVRVIEAGGDVADVARVWAQHQKWPATPRFAGIEPSALGTTFDAVTTLELLRRLEANSEETRVDLAERLDLLDHSQARAWSEKLTPEEAVIRALRADEHEAAGRPSKRLRYLNSFLAMLWR